MKKYKINRKFNYNGEPYYIHADTEAEYNRKYHKKMVELENETNVSGGNTKLKDWAKECVNTYKPNMKPITLEKYKYKVDHYVLHYIGDMRLKDIKPIHCQQTLNYRIANSQATINDTFQILNFLFRKAVENEMIIKNPAEHIQKPKGFSKDGRAITEEERHHIIKVCSQNRKFYLYLLMLYCGCRTSEAAECMGSDIKKVKGANLLHIRGTKSVKANRLVPIPDCFYNIIKNTPKNEYIACYSSGKKITYSNRHNVWRSCKYYLNLSMGCKTYRNKLLKPYPLANDLVPYCLRHTYCTDLARQGIDIRIAQKLLGHTDIRITANIYTNLDDSDVLLAAKLINKV